MLTFTLIKKTLMEHKAFLSTWCKTCLRTREKKVFFLNTLKISLAPILQEALFQVMLVGTQQTKEQKELNTRERTGQDATKATSAPEESRVQFPGSVIPTSMTALTWMVKNIPNRTTIEDCTAEVNEARFVRQYDFFHLLMRMLCLCLALMNLLLCVALPSSSFVTMAILIPHWVVNSDGLSPRLRERSILRSPRILSTHNREFDDETMKSYRGAKKRRMKMTQWCQKHNRLSDWKETTGTKRATYHAREPIEDDDERLAMKKGDMPPPVPERVANPKIREDRAVPTELGKDAPCHLRRRPHNGMV